jgi:hypothetical protein
MKDLKETKQALNAIRTILDMDVSEVDISDVKTKLSKLTSLMGTSAEAIASCKKLLHEKELEVFATGKVEKMAPSVANKYLAAMCKEEAAMYDYSDRLHSGLVHCIDGLRSILSYTKSEMENSLK